MTNKVTRQAGSIVTTVIAAVAICSTINIVPAQAASKAETDAFFETAGDTWEEYEAWTEGKDDKGEVRDVIVYGADAARLRDERKASEANNASTVTPATSQATTTPATPATPAVRYGWEFASGHWYYSADGRTWLKSTWQQINGKWYYFYSSGIMATNTTVQGYRIGADGAWIK